MFIFESNNKSTVLVRSAYFSVAESIDSVVVAGVLAAAAAAVAAAPAPDENFHQQTLAKSFSRLDTASHRKKA